MVTQKVKNLPAIQETWVQSLGQEGLLEKWMAAHSRIRAWRIPWTEEPGRLQSKGSQRVEHDRSTFHRNSTGNRNYVTVVATWSVSSFFISYVFHISNFLSLQYLFYQITVCKMYLPSKASIIISRPSRLSLALKEIFNSLIPLKILSI